MDSPPASFAMTCTAIICTANRGDSLVPTVDSLLRYGKHLQELLIVDQSKDDRTFRAIEDQIDGVRVRYMKMDVSGKGKAINLGIAEARGEIIFQTDDDCEIYEGTVEAHLAIFEKYPEVALTYGQVLPAEHDPNQGFIPSYHLEADHLARTIKDKPQTRGIGANTAFRKEVIQKLGGFDPELGPGGKFRACIDGDMTIRCLLAGHAVYETCESRVLHFGFRNWSQGRTLARNAFYGIGASFIKPVRYGYWRALPIVWDEFFTHALVPLLRSLVTRHPTGWQRVAGICLGVLHGLIYPVDSRYLLFAAQKPDI